jgi:23S rRNA-/tRNA-specific pseudouridylate synthase
VFKLALQPVHAAGRYFRHTLVEILKNEFGYEKIYSMFTDLVAPLILNVISVFLLAVNRLDRLTSGLMVLGLSNKTASELSAEFREGNVKKEYIARCKGEFPVCVLPSLRCPCLVTDDAGYRGVVKRSFVISRFLRWIDKWD